MHYTRSARYYDALYAVVGKGYAEEAQLIHDVVQRHRQSSGKALLDLGCGTGGHLRFLRKLYDVVGLDLDPAMLAVARQTCPGVDLFQGDMVSFDLGREFDAVICLFGSIGYVREVRGLRDAVASMSRHTRPGGVIIIEPWFAPDSFPAGRTGALFSDDAELKIARMHSSVVDGAVSILTFHYLVATKSGIEHFTEKHELGLFTPEEYLAAVEASGLAPSYVSEGPTGRGLYVGQKPL
jgi:SAM-dependent methyltransferase